MANEQTSPEPSATPAAPEPSGLEKVYQEYGIEDQAASFQPAPQAPAPTPQHVPAPAFKAPDPFDPNFGAYQTQIAQGITVLNQSLQQTQAQLTQMERQLQQRAVEADIQKAVGTIAQKAGLDPDIAEVALEAKARKDPKFLNIWQNRAKNPKAFNAALEAVSGEFKERFAVRQDPQLVENQRAVAASRNQMATTAKTSENDEWASMSPGERQAKVRLLISRGG